MAIEPQFDSAYTFSQGLAYVETSAEQGYIDKKGDFVWKVPKETEKPKTEEPVAAKTEDEKESDEKESKERHDKFVEIMDRYKHLGAQLPQEQTSESTAADDEAVSKEVESWLRDFENKHSYLMESINGSGGTSHTETADGDTVNVSGNEPQGDMAKRLSEIAEQVRVLSEQVKAMQEQIKTLTQRLEMMEKR
jgi:DNA repair exonuclease SbcCD ATPase subunit